jgi:dTDP-glucose pyrophosphorylase
VNVLILAAGNNSVANLDGYPLCLSEINGKPLIEMMLEKWSGINVNFFLMLNGEELKKFHLAEVVHQIHSKATVIPIYSATAGAVCTSLMAVDAINNDDPLVILNGDEILDVNYAQVLAFFNKSDVDAGVVIFDSVHPRYSYVRLDENNLVVEAAEKNPISRHATVGFYWYRKGKNFVEAAMSSIKKQALLDPPYFVCPVFNELVLKGQKIGAFQIDKSAYIPLKTKQHLAEFQSGRSRSA